MADSSIGNALARDVMTNAIVCAHPQQPLAELELLLIEHRISGAPVVDGGRLVGVISRSDLARVEVLMEALDGFVSDQQRWGTQADGFQHANKPEYHGFRQRLENLQVKDAMHDQIVTCQEDTPVLKIASDMVQHHIHRIIVVRDERPVGVISSLDIVRLMVGEQAESTA
jgi:CBS domain-containing protein